MFIFRVVEIGKHLKEAKTLLIHEIYDYVAIKGSRRNYYFLSHRLGEVTDGSCVFGKQ